MTLVVGFTAPGARGHPRAVHPRRLLHRQPALAAAGPGAAVPLPASPQPTCLRIVYQCTRTPVHTRRILLPGLATRFLNVCS